MRRLSLLLLLLLTSHSLAQPTGVVVIELTNGSHVAVVIGGDGEVSVVPATMIRVSPPVPPNPYPEPTAALKTAVQPLRDVQVSIADAVKLAEMFAKLGAQIDVGPLETLAALNKAQAELGQALGIQRSPALADAINAAYEAAVARPGDPHRKLTMDDARAFRAMAWAIWRAG
jgi:hypothetical protein